MTTTLEVRERTSVLAYESAFTETYIQHEDARPAIREAACLRLQMEEMFVEIEERDVFAGRTRWPSMGILPQPKVRTGEMGIGYYFTRRVIDKALQDAALPEEDRARVQDMRAFWDREDSVARAEREYSDAARSVMVGRFGEGCASPAAQHAMRWAGVYLDFDQLVRLGLPGLCSLIERRRARAARSSQDTDLFDGMLSAIETFRGVIERYRGEAERKAESARGESKKSFERIAASLNRIATHEPEHLHEAMQLVWLYNLAAGTLEHGRLDVVFGDLYAKDLDEGYLSAEEAQALVDGYWRMTITIGLTFDGRVVVGGRGRRNEPTADRFALAAIEATRRTRELLPQLTLRFYKGQDPALMERALTAIGEGLTFPMLYNDDVNVPAVAKAFGVESADAEHYVPFGCGEYVLDHRSMGTPNCFINLLKLLEFALNDGVDPCDGILRGLRTGRFEEMSSFDDLWKAYTAQVCHTLGSLAECTPVQYRVAGEQASFLLISMLTDDCIERGKGALSGGTRYMGGIPEVFGVVNVADSLSAIESMVFRRGAISNSRLLEALRADFAGYEQEFALMRSVPKYGNDDEAADAMAARVHEHVCNTSSAQAARVGLDTYLVVEINNQANVDLGRDTGASAEGRHRGEPLANANNPTAGNDVSGPTALLRSLVKLDPSLHAGVVQNMKFSKSLFTKDRPKLEALLKTYFDLGGTQAMITVVDRGDLEGAMREPSKYRNLFVRVGGFSARFVELSEDIRKHILARTLHE